MALLNEGQMERIINLLEKRVTAKSRLEGERIEAAKAIQTTKSSGILQGTLAQGRAARQVAKIQKQADPLTSFQQGLATREQDIQELSVKALIGKQPTTTTTTDILPDEGEFKVTQPLAKRLDPKGFPGSSNLPIPEGGLPISSFLAATRQKRKSSSAATRLGQNIGVTARAIGRAPNVFIPGTKENVAITRPISRNIKDFISGFSGR